MVKTYIPIEAHSGLFDVTASPFTIFLRWKVLLGAALHTSTKSSNVGAMVVILRAMKYFWIVNKIEPPIIKVNFQKQNYQNMDNTENGIFDWIEYDQSSVKKRKILQCTNWSFNLFRMIILIERQFVGPRHYIAIVYRKRGRWENFISNWI